MAKLISINLLPAELRSQENAKKVSLQSLPSPAVIVAVLVGLIVVAHLSMGTVLMLRRSHLKKLTEEWDALAPQRQKLEQCDSRYASLTKQMSIAQRMANDRILWSPKLHILSKYLPVGIWFREVEISQDNFTLHGSVISIDREEISLIRQFVDNLVNDNEFMKDFQDFELRSVQKRKIVYHDVSDFILVGTLRQKS